MNEESKVARWKWVFFGFVALIVTGLFAWGEFTYLVQGQTVRADIVGWKEVTLRSGRFGMRTTQRLQLDYAFIESSGSRRTSNDTVDLDWPIPSDLKVDVRYTRGTEGKSLVKASINSISPGR